MYSCRLHVATAVAASSHDSSTLARWDAATWPRRKSGISSRCPGQAAVQWRPAPTTSWAPGTCKMFPASYTAPRRAAGRPSLCIPSIHKPSSSILICAEVMLHADATTPSNLCAQRAHSVRIKDTPIHPGPPRPGPIHPGPPASNAPCCWLQRTAWQHHLPLSSSSSSSSLLSSSLDSLSLAFSV
jgi:hypothetical protein